MDFRLMNKIWLLLIILSLTLNYTFGQNSKFESITLTSKNKSGNKIQYLAYVPNLKKYEKTSLPLIIYLHHNSAVGDDLSLVRNSGLMRVLNEGTNIPFIVVAPQLPSDMNMSWDPKFVNEVVKDAIKRFNADSLRITLTGYSLGGNGAIKYASSFPKNILAVISVAGWGNPADACKLRNTSLWAFHGIEDKIVDPQSSRGFCASLKNCGGNVRLTEFPNVGHNIWRNAYTYDGLFKWLEELYIVKTGSTISNDSSNEFYYSIKLPKALSSLSGVSYGNKYGFLGINEANSLPLIVNFDSLGNVKRTIRLSNATNISWQDITQDENGMIYIADFGNSKYNRKSIQIYSFKNSELVGDQIYPEKIEIKLTDSLSLNYKTIFCLKNTLYAIGINKNGNYELVRFNLADKNLNNTGKVIGKLPFEVKDSITSSAFSPSNETLYLTNSRNLIKIKFGDGNPELLNKWKIEFQKLPFSHQVESITTIDANKIAVGDRGVWGANDAKAFIFQVK